MTNFSVRVTVSFHHLIPQAQTRVWCDKCDAVVVGKKFTQNYWNGLAE